MDDVTIPRFRAWPLLLMALPAAVAIWAGWVALGGLCGFGLVEPLPGILPWHLNTAITLPVGMESYAAYALGAWLRPGVPDVARRFARWSAIGALLLGMSGQAAYHLLAAFHVTRAPVPVIAVVSCIPVVALGFGAALAHLLRSGGEAVSRQPSRHEIAEFAAPLVSALAARIAPSRGSARDTPQGTAGSTVQDSPRPVAQGSAAAPARAAKKAAPHRAEWPSARAMSDAELMKRTRAAVVKWEQSHPPGDKMPAVKLAEVAKLRIGREKAGKLLAEVYKPHLVAAAE